MNPLRALVFVVSLAVLGIVLVSLMHIHATCQILYVREPFLLQVYVFAFFGRVRIRLDLSRERLSALARRFIGRRHLDLSRPEGLRDLAATVASAGRRIWLGSRKAPGAARAFARATRSLFIEYLRIDAQIGAADAFQTGVSVGAAWAFAGTVTWALRRHIPLAPGQPRFRIRPDFVSKNTKIRMDCRVKFRLLDIILAARAYSGPPRYTHCDIESLTHRRFIDITRARGMRVARATPDRRLDEDRDGEHQKHGGR